MSRLPRIVAATLLFASLGWVHVGAGEQRLLPAPEGTFSLVVIPDSQHYRGRGTKAQPDSTNEVTNAILDAHTRWIAANVRTQRIAFVTHVGDIVDRDVPEQWAVAKRCMDRLHGRVPYAVCAGNHDMKADGNTALFVKNFGPQRFAGMPWYAGAFESAADTATNHNGASSFQLFSAAGLDFVIVHLECNAPDDMLAWTDGILRTHARRRAIVTTHMGLGPLERPEELDDFRDAPKGRMRWKKTHGERGNTPQQMWDKCFKKHDNLFLILSGDQSRSQALRQITKNERGKAVAEVMSDYNQEKTAWLRVCRFLPAQNRIEVQTVDSASGKLCAGTKLLPDPDAHRFSLDCEMSAPPR